MKKHLTLLAGFALVFLSGCVAPVPYYGGYAAPAMSQSVYPSVPAGPCGQFFGPAFPAALVGAAYGFCGPVYPACGGIYYNNGVQNGACGVNSVVVHGPYIGTAVVARGSYVGAATVFHGSYSGAAVAVGARR